MGDKQREGKAAVNGVLVSPNCAQECRVGLHFLHVGCRPDSNGVRPSAWGWTPLRYSKARAEGWRCRPLRRTEGDGGWAGQSSLSSLSS